MDRDMFIDLMREGSPEMARMVDEGYCSWEGLGYEGGEDEPLLEPDEDEGEQE